MAKLNLVFFQGKIKKIVDKRHVNQHVFVEIIVDRERTENVDEPIIMTNNPKYIEELLSIKEDVDNGASYYMYTKGSIETYQTPLSLTCTNDKCGVVFERYVLRTFCRAKILNAFKSDYAPSINEVVTLGLLTTDVRSEITSTKTQRSTFKLGLNVSRTKAFYPWVVSFGDQAVMDKLRMRHKSQCVVRGFYQTRPVAIGCTCPVCGVKQPRQIVTTEIHSLGTEYLNNCVFESKEAEEEREFMEFVEIDGIRDEFPPDHPIHRENNTMKY